MGANEPLGCFDQDCISGLWAAEVKLIRFYMPVEGLTM